MKTILFTDGTTARRQVCLYSGGCLTGQPTAYVICYGQVVWVKPGESVEFVEAR